MEWRIIVPVLCLIGILHVRGNAAQSNSNTSTINNNTITEGTTNSTANANQTESTNPNATVSQTASSNATATATVSQTASSNATATATASQTASSNTNATTNPSATATPTPANTASLNLVFKLTQNFKPVFSDLNNPETKQLADEITNAFSPVYRKQFANFRRMFIRKFSAGSVVTDSVLEFDNTNASPNLTEVKNTFADAITAGNVNITVDITSISVSNITTTNVTTNPTATANQTASSNTTATANQTASSNTTATANQTASSNTTATANQTASSNTTATANQTASSNTTATANQTASSNTTATTNLSATTLQSTTPATTVSTSAATTPTPANTASLNLVFKLTKTFKLVFSDLNNPETKQLADEITNAFTPVYRKRFANFRRMFIRKFSAGSVVTDSVLEFDNTNASPNLTEVKNTFVDAITAGNVNITVDNTSISVSDITTTNVTTNQTATTNLSATTLQSTTPATTVSTSAATTPTPANTASLNLVFKLTKTFKLVFSDLNNPETKQLADEITNAFTPVYRKRFANFRRMFIRKFSAGSVVTDSVLEFDNTNASPNLTEVKNTFVDAITAGGFNFTVDNTSISVSDITTTNATTQATTIVSTTAGFNLSDYNVTFTMNETFSSELSNISSSRAVALAKNITAQFDGVFKKLFTNFVRSLIWRFRNGSIIVDALLGFDKTGSSPTAAEVVKVIVASAKNGTFTFTVNSLSVTDPSGVTANRSPVLASMMTALWMTLASLVVSAVMH